MADPDEMQALREEIARLERLLGERRAAAKQDATDAKTRSVNAAYDRLRGMIEAAIARGATEVEWYERDFNPPFDAWYRIAEDYDATCESYWSGPWLMQRISWDPPASVKRKYETLDAWWLLPEDDPRRVAMEAALARA